MESTQDHPSVLERPRLLTLGDTAWTVEFGDRIDKVIHGRVLGLAGALEEARLADRRFSGIVDVVPTFRSLTVHYDPLCADGTLLGESLLKLADSSGSTCTEGRRWRIPVCFDADFSPDLDELAAAKAMKREEVIAQLTSAEFQVYLIGFMPGFPYMGGLPPALEMPRLASPRKAVPARSLAIAGAMCAVYPWESPGGWRLLGRTPVPFFSATEAASPSLLTSGDRVRWQAVERARFEEIEAAGLAGRLDRLEFLESEGAS